MQVLHLFSLKRSDIVCIRPFLIVKMKSLVVSSAGLYCRGCTEKGRASPQGSDS